MAYLQRALQATLTIALSITLVILAAFALSEGLRLTGIVRADNILITFLVSLPLLLLSLWLLPRSLLTLKEGAEQGYLHRILLALALVWLVVALLLTLSMGLYAALARLGVEPEQDLLITFTVSLVLLLLALWLLPR